MRYLILVLALCLTASAQPIFGGGGGASIFKPRGATLPASCTTDGLVYVLTADDGGNARGSYVCLNGTYASMTAASAGTGDVVGTTGAGVPSANCTAGKAVYVNTTTGDVYACNVANTWVRVLTSDDTAAGLLKLFELPANGGNFRAIGVPDALTGDVTYYLPAAEAAAGQVWVHGAPSGGSSTGSWMTPAPAADPVFTGSAQIPNGTGPTVDAAGEVAVDTTTDQLQFYGGAKRGIPSIQHISFVIPAPADTDDINLMKAPYGMTILGINAIVQGTTSATGQIQECSATGTDCADLDSDIVADADGAADDGTLTDSTIASGAWLRWKTTSVSGTPTFLTVTVRFRVVVD